MCLESSDSINIWKLRTLLCSQLLYSQLLLNHVMMWRHAALSSVKHKAKVGTYSGETKSVKCMNEEIWAWRTCY